MAECQEFTNEQKGSCRTQGDLQPGEGSTLVPLSLPPGVTPEIAARLTTSILMRRAYCSTCPWTQWLLLASVGILHGQATPTLDSVSLHILQGTLNEKLASCGDLSGDAEEDANPVLSVEQTKEKTDHLGENTADDTIPFTMDSANEDLKSNFNADKSLIEASPTSKNSPVTGDKNTLEITLTPLKNSSLKTRHFSPPVNNPSENKNPLKVTHNISKDYDFIEENHNQQTSSVPPKENKSPLQEIHPLPKDFNLNEDRNSIETSYVHLKKHCFQEDNILIGSSHNYHKKHHIIKDVISSETDHTSCSSKGALLHRESIGVQVTPRKLGILASKWVQVKVPRQIEVGVQTELLPSCETVQVENVETQTHVGEYIDCLPKAFADKEAQTVIRTKRDTSSQTGDVDSRTEDQPSQPLWRMISLLGVPNRKKKSKMKNNDQEESNNLGKGLKGISAESSTPKGKQLFHGRPMLKGKVIKPVEIPLDSVVSLLDSALQDPRLFLRSDCI